MTGAEDGPREAVESLFQRGMAARREGRPAEALEHMKAAVALARAHGDPIALARALHGRANVERDRGRSDIALRLYREAIPLCRQGDDPLVLSHTLRHLGDVLRASGDLATAEPCYTEALALYRVHGATPALDVANAVRPLALLRETLGQREEARALWREARDLYREAGVEAGVAESSAHLEQLG
ncbi:tetratricopeptide repeat protein [Candidatus Palauibacter sp.]|uniref:tetratricopeptide repeat protein n=1 Tax=Candidatus Palauibacter sp. TaxID=3101350 RepID=UPI003B016197